MDDLNNVGKTINSYSGLISKAGVVLVILSTFFLFAGFTTEIYDAPKFIVLAAVTGIMLVLITLKFTLAGKVLITRTPLDIPLLLLLAVGIVSTLVSPSQFVSLLGNQLRVHGSLVSLAVYVLFYFVLVNSLKGIREIKWIFHLGVLAAQILAVGSLLAYAGVKLLPAPWSHGTNFTLTGSPFSTTAILALLLPFIITQILSSSKPLPIILNSIFLLISGLAIALTGVFSTWIAALVGLGLTLFVSNIKNIKQIKPISLIGLISPLVLIALVTILSFVPPMENARNPIHEMAQSFQREIQLNAISSWKISISTFRDSPFWGSGPSTYLFDFTNYKPIEFNSSKLWNLRFDNPFNEYLLALATLGGVGVIALLSFTVLFISSAVKTLKSPSLQTTLAISGLIFFILLALHSSTLPLWVAGILILASFMVVNLQNNPGHSFTQTGGDFKSMFLKIAANVTSSNSSEETIKVDALPGILLVVSLGLVIAAGFFGGKIVLADYHHKLALNAVAQNNGILAYNELVMAEKLNPQNDLYRTNLAQTNFALANAIASAKGPTDASPAGTLTDQDKQNIQVLLSQSIAEGRAAVTLSPRSAINWEILAMLYRQISGVAQNALVFSLDSYGRAIMQDPLNPNLRLAVGGVYYAISNHDMAIRFFSDAINLKPDFANGYYNLSVALRDKGDLAGAQAAAEKVLTLVDINSQDYKAVSDYLQDLKSKTASPSQPPAAETSGALKEEKLPKVVDVGTPPAKIATPEAIKKPSPTPAKEP